MTDDKVTTWIRGHRQKYNAVVRHIQTTEGIPWDDAAVKVARILLGAGPDSLPTVEMMRTNEAVTWIRENRSRYDAAIQVALDQNRDPRTGRSTIGRGQAEQAVESILRYEGPDGLPDQQADS